MSFLPLWVSLLLAPPPPAPSVCPDIIVGGDRIFYVFRPLTKEYHSLHCTCFGCFKNAASWVLSQTHFITVSREGPKNVLLKQARQRNPLYPEDWWSMSNSLITTKFVSLAFFLILSYKPLSLPECSTGIADSIFLSQTCLSLNRIPYLLAYTLSLESVLWFWLLPVPYPYNW